MTDIWNVEGVNSVRLSRWREMVSWAARPDTDMEQNETGRHPADKNYDVNESRRCWQIFVEKHGRHYRQQLQFQAERKEDERKWDDPEWQMARWLDISHVYKHPGPHEDGFDPGLLYHRYYLWRENPVRRKKADDKRRAKREEVRKNIAKHAWEKLVAEVEKDFYVLHPFHLSQMWPTFLEHYLDDADCAVPVWAAELRFMAAKWRNEDAHLFPNDAAKSAYNEMCKADFAARQARQKVREEYARAEEARKRCVWRTVTDPSIDDHEALINRRPDKAMELGYLHNPSAPPPPPPSPTHSYPVPYTLPSEGPGYTLSGFGRNKKRRIMEHRENRDIGDAAESIDVISENAENLQAPTPPSSTISANTWAEYPVDDQGVIDLC